MLLVCLDARPPSNLAHDELKLLVGEREVRRRPLGTLRVDVGAHLPKMVGARG